MNKEVVLYINKTHTVEYYSALKKSKEIPSFTTWMDLEDIMLTEIRQKKKQI